MNHKTGHSTSISRNFSVSLVLVLVVVIAVTVAAHCLVFSHNEKTALGRKAEEILANLQKSVELPIWNFDREALEKICDAYFLSDPVSEIVLTEGRGQDVIIQKKDPDETDTIVREGEVLHNGETIARIKIGLTRRHYRQRLENLILSYGVSGILLIVILVLITGVLLRIFLKKPFEDVILGIDRIAAGDFSHKLTRVRQAEFHPIVARFENMAKALQEREQSLKDAKNYIVDLFNAIDAILVGVDDQGRITHWNRRADQVAGKSMVEALGEHFTAVFPWLEDRQEMVARALAGGSLEKDLKFQVQGDDSLSYVSIAVAPLTAQGKQGAVIRIDDVTERVRLEEMMIQTEKMLSVGGLAAGMAHEINNPLAGMLQNAQVIENRLSSETMPANLKAAQGQGITISAITGYMTDRGIFALLRSIREAGGRAARIVENMLSFSRKSNSTLLVSDLRTIVDETLELAANDYDLKQRYDFRQIEIRRQYCPVEVGVPCDTTKIQQVILNILKNGAQAMVESRDAGMKPCFTICIQKEQDMGVVQIQDNGPGMGELVRKRIFEPFFTTKPIGIGTGLGLSVSYFIIVENHGGTLDVDSTLGRGARFTIRLPMNKPAKDSVCC